MGNSLLHSRLPSPQAHILNRIGITASFSLTLSRRILYHTREPTGAIPHFISYLWDTNLRSGDLGACVPVLEGRYVEIQVCRNLHTLQTLGLGAVASWYPLLRAQIM